MVLDVMGGGDGGLGGDAVGTDDVVLMLVKILVEASNTGGSVGCDGGFECYGGDGGGGGSGGDPGGSIGCDGAVGCHGDDRGGDGSGGDPGGSVGLDGAVGCYEVRVVEAVVVMVLVLLMM